MHPGLYASSSSFVHVFVGLSGTPDTPASSCMRSAKKSGLPGGGCICLVCTSYVACSCSCMVVARGLRGFWPYVGDGIREKASGVWGSRCGGLVMWQNFTIWLVLCRWFCIATVRLYCALMSACLVLSR